MPTNFFKNKAAVIAPPVPAEPVLLNASYLFSKYLSYGENRGNSHIGSICSLPSLIIRSPKSSSLVNKAGNSVPKATRAAPVRVAKSITKSLFTSFS